MYSRTGEFDPQAALFYSDKRILQATLNTTYQTHTPYHNDRPITEVVSDEPAGIILKKEEVDELRANYPIDVR